VSNIRPAKPSQHWFVHNQRATKGQPKANYMPEQNLNHKLYIEFHRKPLNRIKILKDSLNSIDHAELKRMEDTDFFQTDTKNRKLLFISVNAISCARKCWDAFSRCGIIMFFGTLHWSLVITLHSSTLEAYVLHTTVGALHNIVLAACFTSLDHKTLTSR
jgi:hypothetical protein